MWQCAHSRVLRSCDQDCIDLSAHTSWCLDTAGDLWCWAEWHSGNIIPKQKFCCTLIEGGCPEKLTKHSCHSPAYSYDFCSPDRYWEAYPRNWGRQLAKITGSRRSVFIILCFQTTLRLAGESVRNTHLFVLPFQTLLAAMSEYIPNIHQNLYGVQPEILQNMNHRSEECGKRSTSTLTSLNNLQTVICYWWYAKIH